MIRFPIGHLVATCNISDTCNSDKSFRSGVSNCLNRHMNGDWGDLCEDDKKANDSALVHGDRLLSSYIVEGKKVWIITESDRSATTILFPYEY